MGDARQLMQLDAKPVSPEEITGVPSRIKGHDAVLGSLEHDNGNRTLMIGNEFFPLRQKGSPEDGGGCKIPGFQQTQQKGKMTAGRVTEQVDTPHVERMLLMGVIEHGTEEHGGILGCVPPHATERV